MKVDFYRHSLAKDDADAVARVLDSAFLTTGKVSQGVEEQLAAYFDVPHALLCSSWTSGATAVLLALGIGAGDEVIVPAMTFIASANVVELLGAKAVLVDVDPHTLLMTSANVAAALTPRTRAVIPVHLYGQMVDVAELRKCLDEYAQANPEAGRRIAIVEDCAHCFEGKLRGVRPGADADAAVFSFYATKNVTCGEGGGMIFRDSDLYEAVRETRLHGMSAIAAERFSGGGYNHWDMRRLGVKANLPDLLAALLPDQISSIDQRLPQRQELADTYRRAFNQTPLRQPEMIDDCLSAWHLFAIGVEARNRDEAVRRLNQAGVSVTVNYRALPDLTYYGEKYPDAAAACPVSVEWGRQTISLPFYPGMPKEHQLHVIDTAMSQLVPLAVAD